jgi:hypothetical protein
VPGALLLSFQQLDNGPGDACNKKRNINCSIFSYFNMNIIFPLENHKGTVDVGSQHSWLSVGLTAVALHPGLHSLLILFFFLCAVWISLKASRCPALSTINNSSQSAPTPGFSLYTSF